MIYLIRHAQSVGNANGRTRSHASIELTDEGKQQAQALALTLPHADRILISPFLRTLQTAEPTLLRDQIEPEVMNIEEFSYLSDTKFQNTTLDERMPYVKRYWSDAEIDYLDADDAESFRTFYARVQAFIIFLDKAKSNYTQKNMLVFTHGQFLTLFKLIAYDQRALSKELMQDFRQRMLEHPIKNAEFFIYQ